MVQQRFQSFPQDVASLDAAAVRDVLDQLKHQSLSVALDLDVSDLDIPILNTLEKREAIEANVDPVNLLLCHLNTP